MQPPDLWNLSVLPYHTYIQALSIIVSMNMRSPSVEPITAAHAKE